MNKSDIQTIEGIIGYEFEDKRLLVEALTHSSYANENADLSYQRLEFLGDSILGFIVSSFLYNQYKEEDEGFLTKTKAKIVSGKSLSSTMDAMGLIKYVRTSQGSIEDEIIKSNNVKEDIFESIIGAIMIDSGDYKECEKYVYRHLGKSLNNNYLKEEVSDYKSRLLEYFARKQGNKVEFLVQPLGNNVNSGFEATVIINGDRFGKGEGVSKKKAEQLASKRTLDMLRIK